MIKDFFDLLVQYWLLIVFITGIIWALIKLYFEFKYFKQDTVPEILTQISLLKDHLDKHDMADAEMAKELKALIDRNKTTTEQTSEKLQGRLTIIGEDLAVVKNNINLIIGGKIKDN